MLHPPCRVSLGNQYENSATSHEAWFLKSGDVGTVLQPRLHLPDARVNGTTRLQGYGPKAEPVQVQL